MDQENSPAEEPFDPYYVWLGIPPHEQPPTLYRLLGIAEFEEHTTVIQHAADRQLTHLRRFQVGPRREYSQQLSNQIAQARLVLLSPDQKASYDRWLWGLRQETAQAHVPITQPAPGADQVPATPALSPEPAAIPLQVTPVTNRSRPVVKRPSRHPVVEGAKIVAGSVAGLLVGYAILSIFYPDVRDRLIGRPRPSGIAAAPQPPRGAPPQPRARLPDARDQRVNPPETGSPTSRDSKPSSQTDSSPASEPGTTTEPSAATESPASTTEPASETAASEEATEPVAIPRSPWDLLPRNVDLPSVESDATQPLFTLPVTDAPIELELLSELANVPDGNSLRLETLPSKLRAAWQVVLAGPGTNCAESTQRVAALGIPLDSSELIFRWSSDLPPATSRQLRNCLLKLRAPGQSKQVSLRPPQATLPLSVNLELKEDESRSTHDFQLEDLPRREALVLELTTRSFPSEARFQGGRRQASLDESLVVEFGPEFRAKLEVRWRRTETGLSVVLAPQFNDPSGEEYVLSFSRLAKWEQAVRRGAAEAEATNARLKPQLEQGRKDLNDLERRANTARRADPTSAQAAGLATTYRARRSALEQRARQFERNQREIALLPEKLKRIPPMQELMNSIHQRAQLEIRILARKDDTELDLVVNSPSSGT